MSSITIQQKGITSIPADAIVNAANSRLWAGGGVCGVIFNKAGMAELTAACNAIGHCDEGSAVITPGFACPCKFIIHAVGPQYLDGKHGEPDALYGAYKRSLELCRENDIHSVVFPLISAGIFGYPLYDAWAQAIYACKNFINKNQDYNLDHPCPINLKDFFKVKILGIMYLAQNFITQGLNLCTNLPQFQPNC